MSASAAAMPASPGSAPFDGSRQSRRDPRREPRRENGRGPRGISNGAEGGTGGGGAGADAEDEKGMMRIRATSKPQLVAGAIANKLRDGEEFSLNGIGADSVNQAVKSLCIARDYLETEAIDVHAWPTLVNSVGPDVVSMKVLRAPSGWTMPTAPIPEAASFKVAGGTKPGSLAGALAGKIREGETHLCVTSIGPVALLRSLKSIALAIAYAEGDGFKVRSDSIFFYATELKITNAERILCCVCVY